MSELLLPFYKQLFQYTDEDANIVAMSLQQIPTIDGLKAEDFQQIMINFKLVLNFAKH